MRIIRWILLALLGLVLALTLASLAYNAATADADVPVSELWHGKTLDGTAYRQWGTTGSPIILVGGFLEPSSVWEKVGPLLARGHRVYALDLDGFGYTARRGVASRIVLLDGDGLRSGGPPRWLAKALVHSPYFTTIYRFLLRSPWAVKRLVENAYGPHHPKIDGAEIRRWTNPFRAKDARQALQKLAEHGITGFARQDLQRLHVPSLVVWGASDDVDPVAAGRQSARNLGARFVLVPGAGHLSMLAAANAVARAIANGLKTQAA